MAIQLVASARIPDEKPYAAWEDILARMSRYSFFQTPAWTETILRALPGTSTPHRWFRFSDDAEMILPLIAIPKYRILSKLESLPWGTYGGMIGIGIGVDHVALALKKLISLRSPTIAITCPPQSLTLPDRESSRFHIAKRTTHLLELDPPFEEIFQTRFQPRARTAIRRARESGCKVSWAKDRAAMAALKILYIAAAKKWEANLAIPETFFDTLEGCSEEQVRVWSVEKEGRILAADLIFYGKGEAHYHTGARHEESDPPEANKFLMSEIIRDACARGYRTFNFGASAGLTGVEQFKEIFGGVKTDYYTLTSFHLFFERILLQILHG